LDLEILGQKFQNNKNFRFFVMLNLVQHLNHILNVSDFQNLTRFLFYI